MPTTGSSDYFNSCSLESSINGELIFSVPENYFGYQNARTGNAYGGYYADLSIDNNNYYEYMSVKLSQPLIGGKIYELTYYVSLADSFYTAGLPQQFIDHSAAYLSNDSLTINNFLKINNSPQVESTNKVFLNDSTGWQKVSGYFVANGGESYLTIGCFEYFDEVLLNFTSELTGQHAAAYYFVDDVSLSEANIELPNIFTPNQDGNNDYFSIPLNQAEFQIMNRWGNLVFDSKETNSKVWDGTVNGLKCSEGTYFYIVQLEQLELKGFIELIR
jgi:gliding motility-associated-like protein